MFNHARHSVAPVARLYTKQERADADPELTKPEVAHPEDLIRGYCDTARWKTLNVWELAWLAYHVAQHVKGLPDALVYRAYGRIVSHLQAWSINWMSAVRSFPDMANLYILFLHLRITHDDIRKLGFGNVHGIK